VLKNDELHGLYKLGKITKEEVAKVLGVSADYIDWLDEKIYKNGQQVA
jgi:DNA-binding XRE family transcriptional regulator